MMLHKFAVTQVTPFSGASDINIFDCNAVIDTSKKVIRQCKRYCKRHERLSSLCSG